MQLPRQRVEAAARDRLRAPLHPLAALQDLADLRVRLQLLQQVVHRERRVAVVEPDDEADRDHVLAHRVDERAAELAELLAGAQRPAHRVDDAVERLRDLPDLLHRELPDLRLLAAEGEAVDRDAGEVALRPLREHRDLGDEVGAGLEVAQLAALAVAALVAGADAEHAPVRDEELLRRGLGQDHRAALLRLLGEEAAELGEREDPVAVVAHRRRRRDRQRGAAGEDVDRLTRGPGRTTGGPPSGSRSPKRRRSALGFTTAPERRCEPGCLPFSSTATGTSPSRSAISGCSSISWPSRIAQARPAGPAPTMRTPTSIRSSAGSVGSAM